MKIFPFQKPALVRMMASFAVQKLLIFLKFRLLIVGLYAYLMDVLSYVNKFQCSYCFPFYTISVSAAMLWSLLFRVEFCAGSDICIIFLILLHASGKIRLRSFSGIVE